MKSQYGNTTTEEDLLRRLLIDRLAQLSRVRTPLAEPEGSVADPSPSTKGSAKGISEGPSKVESSPPASVESRKP